MQWNKHTRETLGSKAQWFALIEKKLFGLNELKKKGKQERKANRIITLDGENSKKVEL